MSPFNCWDIIFKSKACKQIRLGYKQTVSYVSHIQCVGFDEMDSPIDKWVRTKNPFSGMNDITKHGGEGEARIEKEEFYRWRTINLLPFFDNLIVTLGNRWF